MCQFCAPKILSREHHLMVSRLSRHQFRPKSQGPWYYRKPFVVQVFSYCICLAHIYKCMLKLP